MDTIFNTTILDEDVDEPQRVIDTLLRIGSFSTSVGDLHELLDKILNESKELFDCDASSVILYDEETNELFFEVAHGPKAEFLKSLRIPMGQGIAGACAQGKETIIVNDTKSDTRFFKDADEKTTYETRNLVAVPMCRSDRLIGVLEILNKNNNGIFNNDDVKLLEFMGDQAGLAIENAYLIRDKVKAERLAAVGIAVASIAHYAKNLIHGVQGSSEIIEIALKKEKFNMVADTWPILTQSLDRISAMVKDMLTYSKPREPQLIQDNLNILLADIHAAQFDRAQELGVELVLAVDDDLPNSWYDTLAIHDTLLNFTTNAIEACEEVENARVELISGFDQEAQMVFARIKDNGPGIPSEIQKKIFEPFYSTKAGKGTGLGLAVCKKYIEEHQGQLTFESEIGQGTGFGIRLPLEPEGEKIQPGGDDDEPALFA